MTDENKYVFQLSAEKNDYIELPEQEKKLPDINWKVLGADFNYKSLQREAAFKGEINDSTSGIEQEKAINNLQIKAKQNEIERLKNQNKILNKQIQQNRKMYNASNPKNTDLTKLNAKRSNNFNFETDNTIIEPIGLKRKVINNNEQKLQNRADLLYGDTEYNTNVKYSNNQEPQTLLKSAASKNEPDDTIYISNAEKMFYKNGTLAEMLLPEKEDKKPSVKAKTEPEHHKLYNYIAIDYISNSAIKYVAQKLKGNEAAENLYMSKADSYLDTDYARQHLIFNNYLETNSELQPYLEKKITQQIGADKLLTTKGIYIEADSDSSKKMAGKMLENSVFWKEILLNRKALDAGAHINTSMSFTDKNFHNALNNVDILDMHINKKGEIDLLVADIYDFNDNEGSDLVRTARNRQLKGKIIPYFIIYHVIIPKRVKI